MLAAYCPRHDSSVLFTESRISRLRNTAAGIEVELDCYCGEHLRLLRGRTVVSRSPVAA
ncbi:MAG: hypothetical protein ACRDYU_18940 [Actinomycetes bacterium]